MNLSRTLLTAVAAILVCSSSLAAAPSLYGPTGLIAIPTAEALNLNESNAGFDYLWGNTNGTTNTSSWFYKLNLGAFKNWEIGVVAGKVPTEGAFINIKYHVTGESERNPMAIAVGLQNLFSNQRTDVYMVASKKLPNQVRVHFGFKANFADEIYPSIIGGLECPISPQLSGLVDFSGVRKQYQLNAGIRLIIAEGFLLHASLLDIGRTQPNNPLYSVGLSYTSFL
jgi:hypothetical protein